MIAGYSYPIFAVRGRTCGSVRPFVNLYLNEENVTEEAKWDTAIRGGDPFLIDALVKILKTFA